MPARIEPANVLIRHPHPLDLVLSVAEPGAADG
jgi:hypothetical protein